MATGARSALVVLGVLLIVDGLATALGIARVFHAGMRMDAAGGLIVAARLVTGALNLAAGVLVIRSRPAGPVLAICALLASAGLTTAVVADWPIVALVWLYALGWIWFLRRVRRT